MPKHGLSSRPRSGQVRAFSGPRAARMAIRPQLQTALFAIRQGRSRSCIDLIRGIDEGSSMNNDTQSPEAPATKPPMSARKRWLLLVAGSFASIAVVYGVYWTLALR